MTENKRCNRTGDFGSSWPEVGAMSGIPRELTREERTAIRKLVISECVNHDREYGCLPLDCACYMLGKWWTGNYCKYFRDSILPLDHALEAALTGKAIETRPCAICGEPFPVKNSRQMYCSLVCAGKAKKKRNREHMKNKRANVDK